MSLLQNKRVRIYGGLLLLLALSIVLLLTAISDRDARRTSVEPLRFPVLDIHGAPIQHVEAHVKRRQGDLSMEGAKFDPRSGVLTLRGEDKGATVLVAAKGYRIRRLDDVQAGEPIVLQEGLRIRLQVTGDAPPMQPPVIGLFRINPTKETADLARLDPEAKPNLNLAEFMSVLYRNRPERKEMSVARFGFAVAEDDAGSGVMLPAPGKYEVRWGLLDLGVSPGVWWTLTNVPPTIIDVPESGEGMAFEVEITRSMWARTREGLRQEIVRLGAKPRKTR